MNIVKLHWIESDRNDLLTNDTYAIEGSDFKVTEFSLVHDAVAYALPEGYEVAETVSGELAIYDNKGSHCHLDRYKKQPRLSSSKGVVYLKEIGE